MASDTQSDGMKSSKKQPQQKKVLDVSRPKRRPTATGPTTAPQLVIPKRSVMVTVADNPSTSSDPVTPTTPDKTASAPAAVKRVSRVIGPATAPEVKSVDGDTIQVARPATTDAQKPADSHVETTTTEPEATRPAPTPEEPANQDTPTSSDAPSADAPETDDSETAADSSEEQEIEATGTDAKPDDADVRKALEDAKREEEIRGYIDKHEFFVPINSIARKRNVKVTLMLVALELILGLFLLNLMLDAGLIYLLQKIPHTHFFDLQ